MDDRKKRIIAERFFEARTKRNKNGEETPRKVYKETGVTASSIELYENASRVPNMENALILAEHYGVNALWLLAESESPSRDENSQMVTKYTGLSADAVEVLQRIKGTQLSDTLNRLLESSGFIQMLSEFETARTVNVNSTQTEEQAKLIESLNQWGINNGMESKNNRVSDRQLIDIHLWKASQIIGNTFTEILKGERKNV